MKITQEQARKELQKRAKATLAFRKGVRDRLLSELHEKQREVVQAVDDGERFISLCCSRRAGKTYLLATLIILKLLDAGFNQGVFFVAQTQGIGKALILNDLVRLIEEHGLDQAGWKVNAQEGIVKTPAGAALFIIGMDKKTQTEKTRGFKILLAITDETQVYSHLIGEFLDSTGPALADLRGTFIAAGTPGRTRRSTWFLMCHGEGEYQAYRNFHWDIRDNTKFPRPPQDVLDEVRRDLGLTEDHPYYKREYLGIWAEDHSLSVYEYSHKKNAFGDKEDNKLPERYSLQGFRHVIGIDYGFTDATAWTVVAVDPLTAKKYVVYSRKMSGLDGDQAAEKTASLVQTYDTRYVVSDPGGGGKPFYELFNRKYSKVLGCHIRGATKGAGSVDVSIFMVNTELRTGRLLLSTEGALPLRKELEALQYKDEYRDEIVSGKEFERHCADSLRYALMEVVHVKGKGIPEDLTPDQLAKRRDQELLERFQPRNSRNTSDRF